MEQSPLAAQVSVFRGSSNVTTVEIVALVDMLRRIQDGTYRQQTAWLRGLLASGNTAGYKRDKEQSMAFTPCCAMRTRAKEIPWAEKLINITGIVHFDCDHLDDTEGLKHLLAQDPHVVFAFSSPAYGLKIGIAASKITGSQDYRHAWAVALAYLKRTYPDVHLNEDIHVKFLHALCFVSYDPELYVNGDAISLVVPPPAPKPALASRTTDDTADYSRVASALAAIPNNDATYDTWLTLGMALQSTGASWARDLWDSWSRRSDKFNDGKQTRSWQSFSSDGKTTLGTLFHLAKQHGWHPPAAPKLIVPDMTGSATADGRQQQNSTPLAAIAHHVLPDYLKYHPDTRVRRRWEQIYRRTAHLKEALAREGATL